MLAALPVKLEGTVYDLGSGWGGMAFALARRYPGCRVTGFEVPPLPWVTLPKKRNGCPRPSVWRVIHSALARLLGGWRATEPFGHRP